MDPRTPTPGTDAGMPGETLSKYLTNLHERATRLSGIMRAAAHLESEGGCEEGRATLVFLADDLANEMCTALDYVNIPKGGVA